MASPAALDKAQLTAAIHRIMDSIVAHNNTKGK
jgi:hypothetical protein